MDRRSFLGAEVSASMPLAVPPITVPVTSAGPCGPAGRAIHAKGRRGVVGMEHGYSEPGMKRLEKCFRAYRKADAWDG